MDKNNDKSRTPDFKVSSFYKFREMKDLADLRAELAAIGKALDLKGTVLLAAEGINANVAGSSAEVTEFLNKMIANGFADAEDVKSYSTGFNPFRRMLVKIRKEIISLGLQGVRAETRAETYVTPSEFKEWLDEREEMIVLDTRNWYETAIGKFQNAIDLDLKSFQEFPNKIDGLPRKAKIVMYCTGGIRCEKASVVMRNAGFENVFQLKGGILKFNEVYPSTYFDGNCFVFDHRVAVTADNEISDYHLCRLCGNPTKHASECEVCNGPSHLCPSCREHGITACSKRCRNEWAERRGRVDAEN